MGSGAGGSYDPPVTVLDALLEGFSSDLHPRGFHGRFVKGSKVHVVTPQGVAINGVVHSPPATHDVITSRGTERATTMEVHWADGDTSGERPEDVRPGHHPAGGIVPEERSSGPSMAERRAAQAQLEQRRRERATITPVNSPAPSDANHGGFKIGDVVRHETGSRGDGGHGPVTFTQQPGLSTVVGLQRNGNLRIKNPDNGTTHDVHHSHAQKVSALHPDYRGKVAQDAIAAQRAQIAAEKAERARVQHSDGAPVLGALLEGR